jgi:hypothetical protein
MERDLDEIMASQNKMLARFGKTFNVDNNIKLGRIFQKHLVDVKRWLTEQKNIEVIYVSYNDLLLSPKKHLSKVINFLDRVLDQNAMFQMIDPKLYREKRQG